MLGVYDNKVENNSGKSQEMKRTKKLFTEKMLLEEILMSLTESISLYRNFEQINSQEILSYNMIIVRVPFLYSHVFYHLSCSMDNITLLQCYLVRDFGIVIVL